MTLLASVILTLFAATPAAYRPVMVDDVSKPAEIRTRFDASSAARVVNVWATWCVPCVAEMRDLQTIHDRYGPRGIEIIGVSMDDALPGDRAETKARVRRFLDSREISFRNLYYTGLAKNLQYELGFEGEIPITIVYDRKGREVFRVQGQLDRTKLEAQLDKLLAASQKPKAK